MSRKNIAVMAGGPSAEAGISLKSAAIVCRYLNKDKYNVYEVVIENSEWIAYSISAEGNKGEWAAVDKNDFSISTNEGKLRFDAAFVAIHGTPAEDGHLQGYFDMLGIPYNCAGVLASALTFDKFRTKEYLKVFGIKSATGLIGRKSDSESDIIKKVEEEIPFPVFVKPNKNGSSYGASKVEKPADLHAALSLGFEYDDEILIEEYIKGTEVTCGVIRYKGRITALPLTEIRSKSEFFDFKAKYEGNSKEITPAEIDKMLAFDIQETARFIYEKLGFKGMCRIDFIIRGNEYFLLEVNSVPGLSAESIVPQQARAFGLSLQELFENSIEDCL